MHVEVRLLRTAWLSITNRNVFVDCVFNNSTKLPGRSFWRKSALYGNCFEDIISNTIWVERHHYSAAKLFVMSN